MLKSKSEWVGRARHCQQTVGLSSLGLRKGCVMRFCFHACACFVPQLFCWTHICQTTTECIVSCVVCLVILCNTETMTMAWAPREQLCFQSLMFSFREFITTGLGYRQGDLADWSTSIGLSLSVCLCFWTNLVTSHSSLLSMGSQSSLLSVCLTLLYQTKREGYIALCNAFWALVVSFALSLSLHKGLISFLFLLSGNF